MIKNQEKTARRIFADAKKYAAKDSVPFDIELKDVVLPLPEYCLALGIPLVGDKKAPGAAALHCFDPDLGFVRGNIGVISSRAERIKRGLSLAQMQSAVVWLKTNQLSR